MAAGDSPGDQQGPAYEARFEARPLRHSAAVLTGMPIVAGTFGGFNLFLMIVVAVPVMLYAAASLRERDYRQGRTALRADSHGIALGGPWPVPKTRVTHIPWPEVVAVHIRHHKVHNRDRRYLEVQRRNSAGPSGTAQPPAVIVERPSLGDRLSARWPARLRRRDQLQVSRWQLDRGRLGEVMHRYAPYARLVEHPHRPDGAADG